MKIILTWICFIGVIAVNALANILPINGYNTGQISAFYPNAFVPAGFTFSIWGVIYTLLLTYTIAYTFYTMQRNAPKSVIDFIDKVHPFYLLTCILNMAWIIAWHYLYLGLSLMIMLAFLFTLIKLFITISKEKFELRPFYRFWIYHPFVVYLGWISVATIANFTALFVGIGWQGEPFAPTTWSILLMAIALILGIVLVGLKKEPAYGFVLAWAFYGIYGGQLKDSAAVGYTAAVASSFILALSFTILIKFKKALR